VKTHKDNKAQQYGGKDRRKYLHAHLKGLVTLLQSDTQLNYSPRIKERKERINNIRDEDEEKMGDRQGDRCVTNRKRNEKIP
jgi:hypothetical protein